VRVGKSFEQDLGLIKENSEAVSGENLAVDGVVTGNSLIAVESQASSKAIV
jgi:hypothetical protein